MKMITLTTSLIITETWTTLTSFTTRYPRPALCILIIHIKYIVELVLSLYVLIYRMCLPFPRLVISPQILMCPLGFIFPLSEELLLSFLSCMFGEDTLSHFLFTLPSLWLQCKDQTTLPIFFLSYSHFGFRISPPEEGLILQRRYIDVVSFFHGHRWRGNKGDQIMDVLAFQ